jgi:uncharacterized protein YsxB (DUF464 family)
MIRAHIVRDKNGFIRQIEIKGHAGFGKEGNDIVCAAVSAVAYTAAGAIGELAGVADCYIEKDGYMLISLPEDISGGKKQTAGIILETAAIGFKQIEAEYGEYVFVFDEEV